MDPTLERTKMTILKNVEIWWPKLMVDKPEKKFTPDNPTWEVQIRTTDKAQRKEWAENHINAKPVRSDPDDDESTVLYYKASLKKKSLKKGKPNVPVVVTTARGDDLDPSTIGNGSIASVRLFPHEYTFEGKTGMTNTLMEVRITKLVKYEPGPMEEMEEGEMEIVEHTGDDTPGDDTY